LSLSKYECGSTSSALTVSFYCALAITVEPKFFEAIFMKTQYLLFCLSGVMALSTIAYAEVNFGSQTPTTNEMIDALDYEGDVIKRENDERGLNMKQLYDFKPKPKPYKPKNTEITVSMGIKFGYNTAELTEDAKTQLQPVGEAFQKLSHLSFVLEGHTDAIGSQAYNKTLSEARAASVKDFLVSNFKVQADRIEIVGKGKEGLLDPNNPTSDVNRRVRIIRR
jgi:outer membrane protein OmpA-like peptidoglycan-associated protein